MTVEIALPDASSGQHPPVGCSEVAASALTVAVIVVAAGSGTRLGQPVPKAFAPVAARPILAYALEGIFALEAGVQVVVVVPAEWLERASVISRGIAGVASGYLSVVAGGPTRQQSVAAGLEKLQPTIETVLVHDAARAFTPTAVFDAVIAAVQETGAGVIPVLAVSDTIKEVANGFAGETIDRSRLAAVQTPQGFPRKSIVAAYLGASAEYTDDAALFAAAGHPVRVIDGDARSFKITTPWDLRRAETLAVPAAPQLMTGVGIDVHAWDDTSPLWLGGMLWPGERGLSGHSDGDAICHAMCDAMLSAAGLGDLGSNFGTSDPRFADAHGEVFLSATLEMLHEHAFAVGNIAVQVIANRPKIGARRAELELRLSHLVGAPVSVAATTSDALGFTGRGEGLAVIATCLLQVNR